VYVVVSRNCWISFCISFLIYEFYPSGDHKAITWSVDLSLNNTSYDVILDICSFKLGVNVYFRVDYIKTDKREKANK